jgi:hypothetical protein
LSLDPIQVAVRFAAALEQLGVDYLVGGSLASSFAGQPRLTLDVDIVVQLTEAKVPDLLKLLGEEWLADPKAVARAVRQNSSTNLFHAASGVKVDLFMLGASPFEQGQMRRRRKVKVGTNPDTFLFTYAPEDILLQKLRWYRMGGGVSDTQWRDVLSIVRGTERPLDREYLREGARAFEVETLLGRVFAEAENP